MDSFDVGKDCNCPNSHKEHILRYKGKVYLMQPRINGMPNYEYVMVKKFFSSKSYMIKDYLDELKDNYSTWKEV